VTAPEISESDRQLVARVDEALATILAEAPIAGDLRRAAEHALLGGGKRMRPLLVLRCAAAVGGSVDDALPAAAAIELVHAFSLVHDDLPALDNDAMRRGRPTVHVAFGEAMAILAGDLLLALATEVATGSPRQALAIVAELSRATVAMIHGQVLDTLRCFTAGSSDRERLLEIHANKTGALLVASCRMGGFAADAAPSQLDALTRWGKAIGLMFQIVDDLLDETQTAEHIGKAVGKDREAGKLTFPGVLGLEASRAEVRRLEAEADAALAPLGSRAAPLAELSRYLANRTR
jgi:geranylgeranyl pyrophosphate synthase